MKKQTAVEWLEQLYDSRPNYEQFILSEEFKIAKEIEKEQIIYSHISGMQFIAVDGNHYYNDSEQYFNKTYNKNT
jgi:hypothetical protein